MTDIVKRLRDNDNRIINGQQAEIERLREHKRQLLDQDKALSQMVTERGAEIERLREELAETEGARVLNANALRLAQEKIERLYQEIRSQGSGWAMDVAEIERLRELRNNDDRIIKGQQAKIERLRYMLQRIVDEVELPQSIERSAREALGDE